MRLLLPGLLVWLVGLVPPARPVAAPPASPLPDLPPHLMAPTDPRPPAEERKHFTLPPGFDAQLVASEPDIGKPMQMAFDARGRLWVTTSHHYPFAAPPGQGTDKLFVLSDIDPATGKAGKVHVFAEDLNIPIGVLPLPDGRSVLVSSCGEIRKYAVREGPDGPRSGGYEVLFSGFGYRDTHGMYNSFTLMPDGWVYACHGFANESTVKGRDGHEVRMHSGHTFRFRPDGSRIEIFTHGQVNPFGMAVDPWFNLYTADCHSKPITQLIPGAYYDSFGKPHDGLGYGPHVTRHDHGSTGLCGLVWYDADHFPRDYRGTMFVGNVVTNRVHCDHIEWQGASPVARERPDLLVSSDRWFRPVDLKLGPDGAVYIADFYNKIIGHYEVDLKDPRRDRTRGRIWRVVWKGPDGTAPPPRCPRADFTTAAEADLLHDLFHPNLTVRFLAGHQLRRRVVETGMPPSAEPIAAKLLADKDRTASVVGWLLFLNEAGRTPYDLQNYQNLIAAAANSEVGLAAEQLTGHLVRALTARPNWGEGERRLLAEILKSSSSPHQRRAAAEAAIHHPHPDLIQPLLDVLRDCPEYDTHLRHALRLALRNCLREADAWPRGYEPAYADVALAIPTARAAAYLLAHREQLGDRRAAVAAHIARHGDATTRRELLDWLANPSHSAADPEPLLAALRGWQARGNRLTADETARLARAAEQAIAAVTTGPDRTGSWGLRVLNALPAVSEAGANPPAVSLSSATIDRLVGWAGDATRAAELRAAAAEVLVHYARATGLRVAGSLLADPALPEPLRASLAQTTAGAGSAEGRQVVRDVLKTLPYRSAVTIAAALAATPAGAEDLLAAVRAGQAPARLLHEPTIIERLRATRLPRLDQQLADLTRGLPPPDQKLADLIRQRAASFATARPDPRRGAEVFARHCAACHRIGDQGGRIAPQLDGIGGRGLERLLEDILDPNRNVDQAFRARVVVTTDDRSVTGLLLRTDGEVLILADTQGREVRIPTAEIVSNRETMLSPMPANFGEIIPEAELADLLAYLLKTGPRRD